MNQFIVDNWKNAWKWISAWALALIVYVSTFGIPNELMQLLPAATQSKVTALLAIVGFVGRFINQTKPEMEQ